ncbi:MAG: hypothetical protein QM537_08670, partial [Candidatus Symbiobacter sp.]|nr:hypothetical protein [Candidatus Symbiobacter sp.]
MAFASGCIATAKQSSSILKSLDFSGLLRGRKRPLANAIFWILRLIQTFLKEGLNKSSFTPPSLGTSEQVPETKEMAFASGCIA